MKYNFEQKRNDYETPPELVKLALDWIGAEKFDLDTCCSRNNIPAKKYFINGFADGLTWDWEKLNWCNPPYNECEKWVKKAYHEQQKGNYTVMLIPVRTETKYWQDYIINNYRICLDSDVQFLRKGWGFIDPETKENLGVFKNALALVFFKGFFR